MVECLYTTTTGVSMITIPDTSIFIIETMYTAPFIGGLHDQQLICVSYTTGLIEGIMNQYGILTILLIDLILEGLT